MCRKKGQNLAGGSRIKSTESTKGKKKTREGNKDKKTKLLQPQFFTIKREMEMDRSPKAVARQRRRTAKERQKGMRDPQFVHGAVDANAS